MALAGLRVLCAYDFYLFEGDELSIATGVAALVTDNAGDSYRYGPRLATREAYQR